ncbi:unnamed protein product [Brachionus calyciflorus]|uniref:Exocyst complex component Sec6 n=1 Tax=Brachionus calyciflorus TaxID=104777 RepID=A0A813P1C7_9BILA|nr:unnamed protein product [Brachionus calyciflorus]
MDSTTTLNKLKEQAEINALKRLQNQFGTSEQLEQIEQHISRNEKTKNMIENQLKSAIQSHFISVNSCMDQLKDVNKNMIEVKDTIYSIQEEYKTISHLENTLGELRKEAMKHKQLKSAKENVQNILNVHDLSKKAQQHIDDENILLAHKCIFDMEKCRNDILEELGNTSDKNHNIDDIKLVEEFFKKVKELQKTLHNHIFVTIKRMHDVSKSRPEQLVTALRIIAREEALDEYWIKKKQETGFAPSDRPRRWREECFETIRQLIDTKLQGCRILERETDEFWFSKHLGNISSRFLEDLEVVKKLCEPCFPPSMKLFDFYAETVHESISKYFLQLIDSDQIKEREFYILLEWINNTYKSEYLFGNPKLNFDVNKLPDLLDESYYQKVVNNYSQYNISTINVWLQNTLDKSFKEWMANSKPIEIESCYESNLPNDIHTISAQQFSTINIITDDRLLREFLKNFVNLFNNFIDSLKDNVASFRAYHSKQTQSIDFLVRMITTSNDCIRLRNYFISIRDRYDTFMDKDEVGGPNDVYELLGAKTIAISDLCLEYIIDDMTKCLDEKYFKILLTRDWVGDDSIVDTIINTSHDYMQDLRYLKPESQLTVLVKWHNRIKVEYMKGFFQNMSSIVRKFQFTSADERKRFSAKFTKEIFSLEEWFKTMSSTLPNKKNAFDFEAVNLMNKILHSDDPEFLYMEIASLVKKCPNLTSDMLFALLSLRGDISKADYKEKFEDYIKPQVQAPQAKNSKSPGTAGGKDIRHDEAIAILKKEMKIQ